MGVGRGLGELADRKVALGLKRWRECIASGKWPAYSTEPVWAEPPGFALWDIEQREIA